MRSLAHFETAQTGPSLFANTGYSFVDDGDHYRLYINYHWLRYHKVSARWRVEAIIGEGESGQGLASFLKCCKKIANNA